MSHNQSFERLIRLEDEELSSNDDFNTIQSTTTTQLQDQDSCKVPMLSSGDSKIDDLKNLFPDVKHKQNKNRPAGFHFTINGRRIQMNPEQLKYLSLITLTFQNAALNLTMRAAKTQREQFSTPVAVTLAELLKLFSCLLLVWYEEKSIQAAVRAVRTNIVDNYVDTLKVAVPSLVYYIQNNLLYVGSTHLDAATGQVTYQLKILTTAVFSVAMLGKKLSRLQWISLVTLFFGVALIETMTVVEHVKPVDDPTRTTLPMISDKPRNENPLLGFLAILVACCLSGFAGVYFEKILKNSSHVSLWIRNIQLSVLAIPIGLIQVLISERETVSDKGFLYGFTALTWLCIVLQAQGGLLVAVVVKFANNILKGFATSMAIVISTIVSMFLFNFNLTPTFIIGASFVISSVMMYNKQ